MNRQTAHCTSERMTELRPAAAEDRRGRRWFRTGSVLVGLLWCLALVSVVVIGALHAAHMDLRVVKNHGDQIQAHYLALAGIEKAKAVIYQDAMERKRAALNHSASIYDAPNQLRDISLGRGTYRVFRAGRRDEAGGTIFGVSDEESRLNINQAPMTELSRLYKMTPEVVASILDWRDGNNTATPGGAEAEYYAALPRPYLPRNAPFKTVRELLMVAGITRDLFAGEDTNLNGLLDPEENDGDESSPADNRDGILDAGWLGDITVDSWVANKNATGEDRVNVQSDDEETIARVPGLSRDIARAIVAHRGQNQLESLADLLEVRAPAPPSQTTPRSNTPQPPRQGSGNAPVSPGSGGSASRPTGPALISEDLLIVIGDDVTTVSGSEQPGVININSASVDVLSCLPGVSPELAQAIVSYRKSAGFFPNIAGLLKVDGVTRDLFKQLAPRISARSETFRILSEGQVTSTGARKRMQVIVRLNGSSIDTLSYREDL